MKLFILILLVSSSSYANICSGYFGSSSILLREDLSLQQLTTLQNLALFEIETRSEQNPVLKNFRLLELQEHLNEILKRGISIQIYYTIAETFLLNKSLKDQRTSAVVKQHDDFKSKTFKQEENILKELNASNITEALFQAFLFYEEGKKNMLMLFLKIHF